MALLLENPPRDGRWVGLPGARRGEQRMANWIRRLLSKELPSKAQDAAREERPGSERTDVQTVAAANVPPLPESALMPGAEALRGEDEARSYLAKVKEKIGRLAEEFASGAINRAQFQELFGHYQRERQTIETWLDLAPESAEWKKSTREGESFVIRKRHEARVLGYAIYDSESGMPLSTIGEFQVDPTLMVPMLSAYRSAAKEIFGGGIRSTQIEGGQWLSFVPGELTTMMTLFHVEPSAVQLQSLDELHRLFERANRHILREAPVDPEALVLPHLHFIGRS